MFRVFVGFLLLPPPKISPGRGSYRTFLQLGHRQKHIFRTSDIFGVTDRKTKFNSSPLNLKTKRRISSLETISIFFQDCRILKKIKTRDPFISIK